MVGVSKNWMVFVGKSLMRTLVLLNFVPSFSTDLLSDLRPEAVSDFGYLVRIFRDILENLK